MSHFIKTDSGFRLLGARTLIPVEFAPGLGVDPSVVLESRVVTDFFTTMDPEFVIGHILIQSVDMFGSRVGFVKLKADVRDETGGWVPGIAFLRGGTVVLLVVLMCEGVKYTILCEQARFPVGCRRLLEAPAGMLDDGKFSGVAAKELEEELGLVFSENDLIDMLALLPLDGEVGGGNMSIYFSPGGSDEFARYFLAQKEVSRADLKEILDAIHGENDRERIKARAIEHDEFKETFLRPVPLRKIIYLTRDAKSIVAAALYRELVEARLVP